MGELESAAPLQVVEHRRSTLRLGDDVLHVMPRRGHERVGPEPGHDRRDAGSADGRGRLEAEEAAAIGGGPRAAHEGLVPAGARVLSARDRVGSDLSSEIDRQRTVDARQPGEPAEHGRVVDVRDR
jgi:hypothetical protein